MRLARHDGPTWLGQLLAALLLGWLAIVNAHAATTQTVALAVDSVTGDLFKAETHALYQSHDGGQHWRHLNMPSGQDGKIAVVASRKEVIYLGGPGLGVLRSRDGGQSWSALNQGLPNTQVTALTLHADQPNTLYVYVTGHGIYRSDDAGGSWRLMDAGPTQPIRQMVHSNMPGSMQTGWLFAATPAGVSRSMDCFCGWRDAGALAREVHAVSYDLSQPKRVYAVTRDNLLISQDGGEQWLRAAQPSAGIVGLAARPSGELFAVTDKGLLFHSTDQAAHWEPVHG